MFVCVFCLLIGIPWFPLRTILCALWPSTHWWPFWIGLRFLLDFHILVGTFCKTISFCQQKKEALYQIWSVGNAIPVYLCNINAKDRRNCCAQNNHIFSVISHLLSFYWRILLIVNIESWAVHLCLSLIHPSNWSGWINASLLVSINQLGWRNGNGGAKWRKWNNRQFTHRGMESQSRFDMVKQPDSIRSN
jgi:hypothetical protein